MDAKRTLLREVSVEKLERDTDNIRRYARFVIVLKGRQFQVIDNGRLRERSLPYAKLIAVLGPVRYRNVLLKESVLMEIGYSRTRPYTRLERRMSKRWILKARTCVRHLSEEEFRLVYPSIVKCMETIVLECRECWKTRGRWWVPGPGPVERGIYFTVSHSDELMHRQMILEDVRFRKAKYISGHSKRIRRFFRSYKYASYPCGELKRFDRVHRTVNLLAQPGYTPLYRMILVNYFEIGSKTRSLLDAIIKLFKIDVSLGEGDAAVLEPPATAFPKLLNLRCYRRPKQPAVHARGCAVFELVLERSYREQNEVPF